MLSQIDMQDSSPAITDDKEAVVISVKQGRHAEELSHGNELAMIPWKIQAGRG
jgi:hypothetical protein